MKPAFSRPQFRIGRGHRRIHHCGCCGFSHRYSAAHAAAAAESPANAFESWMFAIVMRCGPISARRDERRSLMPFGRPAGLPVNPFCPTSMLAVLCVSSGTAPSVMSRLEAQAQKNRLVGGLGPMGCIRGFHLAAGRLKGYRNSGTRHGRASSSKVTWDHI